MTRGYLSCIWSLFFSRNATISASEIGSRIYVRHRERSAFMTVKLGFSVVAPMRVMIPFSTHGRRTSCCDFDQRCISSRNSIVCRQSVKFLWALEMIRTTSSFFDRTPDRWKNSASREFAMTRARLVFPHPGGHQKSIDGIRPAWINVYIGLPLAIR